jgi:hypothetical protein
MNLPPQYQDSEWTVLRCRGLLFAGIAALLGVLAALGAPGTAVVEDRGTLGVDEVAWDIAGELLIEQTPNEYLSIEGEPTVLEKIVTEQRERRLTIAYAPDSRVETRLPTRVRIGMASPKRLRLRGSGDVRVGALSVGQFALALEGSTDVSLSRLSARRFELHVAGSGDVEVGGGNVGTLLVASSGPGNIDARRLASLVADVSIDGSGDVEVAAVERLAVRIAGAGDIRYRGEPAVAKSINGAGSVVRAD